MPKKLPPKKKTLKITGPHRVKCGRKTEERPGDSKLCELASKVKEFEPGTFGTIEYGD